MQRRDNLGYIISFLKKGNETRKTQKNNKIKRKLEKAKNRK
jgi:hypothetical protein